MDDVSFSIEGVATDERDESLRLALQCEWMRRLDSTVQHASPHQTQSDFLDWEQWHADDRQVK